MKILKEMDTHGKETTKDTVVASVCAENPHHHGRAAFCPASQTTNRRHTIIRTQNYRLEKYLKPEIHSPFWCEDQEI